MTWSKNFRKCIIGAVYQNIFWESFNNSEYIPEWSMLMTENHNNEDTFTEEQLSEVYDIFLSKKAICIEKITKYVSKWDKTFDLIKACLIVFLIEDELNTDVENKLVGHYIKFAQDFAGGENPALVHAVISKVLEENSTKG
jgi:transcription termination factor NusB